MVVAVVKCVYLDDIRLYKIIVQLLYVVHRSNFFIPLQPAGLENVQALGHTRGHSGTGLLYLVLHVGV